MIAVARASVAATMIGEIAFGRMWEKRIFRRGTPIARAARTKSLPFCPSTDPRKSRAKIGTFTTPIAIITEKRPGPNIAAIPIAMSSPGIESMMSMLRMITVSVFPPRKPEQEPRTRPMLTPTVTATTPMSSEKRAP